MKLDETVCEACLPEAEKLSDELTSKFLNENNSWSIVTHKNVKKLEKNFQFKNFIEALKFTNMVADMAEREGHHPSIILEYGSVTVRWWSQKLEGIHEKDTVLSLKTDKFFEGFIK
jgi:4a-hydroxytetrahydrobiopterin dehydratase